MSSLTARIAVLALVVVTTGGSTVRCSSGNLDGILDPGGPAFATTLVLRDAAGTPRSEFAPGAPITFELSVRNRRGTEVAVQFPGGQQFDFVVLASGTRRVLWQWSHGRSFAQTPTEIVFAPGATETFTATWSQVDDAGQPLPPGDYEARGVLVFPEFAGDPTAAHELGSTLEPLVIR